MMPPKRTDTSCTSSIAMSSERPLLSFGCSTLHHGRVALCWTLTRRGRAPVSNGSGRGGELFAQDLDLGGDRIASAVPQAVQVLGREAFDLDRLQHAHL